MAFFDDAGQVLGVLPPDWRDRFRQGSFRGVPFRISSHSYNGGRRSVAHEFPSRDRGNTEDLGKKLPGFSMELYIIGDDYFVQRDALIEALNEEGHGELIHPYLGSHQVQVGPFSLTESVQEGRVARFTVQFITAGVPEFPVQAADAFEGILGVSEETLRQAGETFAETIDLLNVPARVSEQAAEFVESGVNLVEAVVRKVGTVADGVSEVAFNLRNTRANILSLLNQPRVLATRFSDAFSLLFESVTDFVQLSRTLSSDTSSFRGAPIIGTTPTAMIARRNQIAIENLIIQISLSFQARAAIQGDYSSVNESLEILSLFNRSLDGALDRSTSDASFQSLKDLKTEVNRGLPPQNVGQLVSFTPPQILPAMVLVYQLFGDIEKEEELVRQNRIRHPGFVPKSLALEVSSG